MSTPCFALNVVVADGAKLQCSQEIQGLTWEMTGETFNAYMKILSIGGYGLILGVEWMRNVSLVVFDFFNNIINIL